MAHSRKVRRVQVHGEKVQLVDLQAQVARLYLRVVSRVERDDAFDQRRETFSVMSITITSSYISLC